MQQLFDKIINRQCLTNDELLNLINFLFTDTSTSDELYKDILKIYYKRKYEGRCKNGRNTKANS